MKTMLLLVFLFLSIINFTNAQWKKINVQFDRKTDGSIRGITSSGNTIYVGLEKKGIFFSNDNGNNWKYTINDIKDLRVTSISAIGSKIFVGTCGNGILCSSNGQSWSTISNNLSNRNNDNCCSYYPFAINESTIISGCNCADKNLYLTTNGGQSWLNINMPTKKETFRGFAMLGSSIFAKTYFEGIFKSTDNGQNWIPVNDGLPSLKIQNIYTFGSNIFVTISGEGLFRSTDNGQKWQAINNGFSTSKTKNNEIKYYVNCLAGCGNNIFTGLPDGVYVSSDNGDNWFEVNVGLADKGVSGIAITNSRIFIITSGAERS